MDVATNNSTNTSTTTSNYELHPKAVSLLHTLAYDTDPDIRVKAFETFMENGLIISKGKQHG